MKSRKVKKYGGHLGAGKKVVVADQMHVKGINKNQCSRLGVGIPYNKGHCRKHRNEGKGDELGLYENARVRDQQ